jgi:molybdate transport system substrate-binding protein
MSSAPKCAALSAFILLCLIAALLPNREHSEGNEPSALTVYCAAGIKSPVSAIARAYEEEYGVSVRIQYGGSGTLLSTLQLVGRGDLYLSADSGYMDIAREKGLVDETFAVAYLRPVIAVAKDNPKAIQQLSDLLRREVRVSLGNPEAASIGKQTMLLLKDAGIWEALQEAVQDRGVFKPTVNDVANDVKLGTVDAGIVWDATVNQYEELSSVALEGSDAYIKTVSVGVLRRSQQPDAALKFARYLTARDQGLKVFDAMGFPPVEGVR